MQRGFLFFVIRGILCKMLWQLPYLRQLRVKEFTEVELFIVSSVQCMFCFEICTSERRGREKVGSANFKIKHSEPFAEEITPPLYIAAWIVRSFPSTSQILGFVQLVNDS